MGACSSKGGGCVVDNTVISLHGKNVAEILTATTVSLKVILNLINDIYFEDQPNEHLNKTLETLDLLQPCFMNLNGVFDSIDGITLLPNIADLNGDGKISMSEVLTSIASDSKGLLTALCSYIKTVLKEIQKGKSWDETVQHNVSEALKYMDMITKSINFIGTGIDAVKAAQKASAMTTQFTTGAAAGGIPLSPSKEKIDLQQILAEGSEAPVSPTSPTSTAANLAIQ